MRRHAPPEKTLAFFTHEVRGLVYKWRPVFSGLRTWCWKRLLVKHFLHSFGKITTRTKTLLSLYQNVDDVKNSKIKDLLRAANKATVDKIGDLRYRARKGGCQKNVRRRTVWRFNGSTQHWFTIHAHSCYQSECTCIERSRGFLGPLRAEFFRGSRPAEPCIAGLTTVSD